MSQGLESRIARLSVEQRGELERRLQARLLAMAAVGIGPRAAEAVVPLSGAQQDMWLAHQVNPDETAYVIPIAVTVAGELNLDRLKRAMDAVIDRHELLRTTVAVRDGVPVQDVRAGARPEWVEHDLGAEPAERRDTLVAEHLRTLAARSFDLERGPLMRLALLRRDASTHVLILVLHHLVADAWSIGVLLSELRAAYNGQELPELPIQYADWAVWQHDQLRDGRLADDVAYWRERLAGLPAAVEMPTDRPRRPDTANRGGAVARDLPADLVADLRRQARNAGTTVFTVLLSVVYMLMYRYTGETDLVVSTPVAGRERLELEGLIGCFINTLLLRAGVTGSAGFATLLREVAAGTQADLRRSEVPLEIIARELPVEARSPGLMVVFEDETVRGAPVRVSGLSFEPVEVDDLVEVKRDLTISFSDRGDEVGVTISYRADLYDGATANRMLGHLLSVLEAALRDPDREIDGLPLLSADERDQLAAFSGRERTVPATAGPTLVDGFAATVARVPGTLAVRGADGEYTYAELDRASNRLAALLVERGVRPGAQVPVRLERSAAAIVAMLAVLKAGAAYVPIDPDQPDERTALILDGIEAAVVIAASPLPGLPAVRLEDAPSGDTAPIVAPAPASAAYVLYTSGSTGRPKGVVVEHRHVLAYVAAVADALDLDAAGSYAVVQSLAFDSCGTSIYAALLGGGTLHMIPAAVAADGPALAAYLAMYEIDYLKISPSHLSALRADGAAVLPRRALIVGGEASSSAWMTEVIDGSPCRVFNHYGPTETTVGVTTFPASWAEWSSPTVPIGAPLAGSRTYALDTAGLPVPVGIVGELYVGGAQVVRGYLGQPGQTAERFVPDPHGAPGDRAYRTGDLVRWNAAGALEFVGRTDDQIKIRGFRVELGEIDAAIEALPGVYRSAARVCEIGEVGTVLIGYAVGTPELDPAELRRGVAARLPDHMVPTAIVVLDEMPLTSTGKLDRRALPVPELRTESSRAASSAVEVVLCGLFAEVLGVDSVGVNESFFDAGGHSLLATRLVFRIRSVLGVDLSVRSLFDAPSVALLARVVAQAGTARTALIRVADRGDLVPVSFGQRRLWFLDRLASGRSAYHLPVALRLTGAVDTAALRAAFRDVVARHESLRTVFVEVDGEPWQRVVDDPPVDLAVRPTTGEDLPAELADAVDRPFDLAADLPVRATLFVLGSEEHVLLLVLHHIAGDAWSMRPLGEDLSAAYAARRAGRAPEFAPLPVQYVDYTLWQRSILGAEDDPDSVIARQVRYWSAALAGIPEETVLPVDRPRPAVASHRGGTVPVSVDADTHRGLFALARRTHCTVFMVVQAALAILLVRLGAGTDVVIGTPVAGRTDESLNDLIGFFVNTLVLRTDLSGTPTVGELLDRVRTADLAAFSHQDLPFEHLVEVLNPARSLARHPLFQVMLSFDNARPAGAALPGVAAEALPATTTAKFDLSVVMAERRSTAGEPAGMDGVVEYAYDLFDSATAGMIADRLGALLEAIARIDVTDEVAGLTVLAEDESERIRSWSASGAGSLPSGFTDDAGIEIDPSAECLSYVLDAGGAWTPRGITGELFLAGPAVDGDPDRIPDPWIVGGHMVPTGQPARWLADGRLDLVHVGHPAIRIDLMAESAGPWRAASSPLEQALCGLFAEILSVPAVGAEDSFFDLGGHSLLATRLISRVRSLLGVELSVRSLFEAPSPAALAVIVAGATAGRPALAATQRSADDLIPVSFGQRRLWFLDRLAPNGSAYHLPVGLRLTGDLDRGALAAALGDVVTRHEILRTVFVEVDGEPWQRVLVDPPVPVPEASVAPHRLAAERRSAIAEPFDLASDLPIRARLFELSPTEHVMLLVLHHIVGDAWSMGPLSRDLATAYAARCDGVAPDWAPLAVQYADFALWQRAVLGSEDDPDSVISRQLSYWTEALADLPTELALPADRPRPRTATHRGATLAVAVGAGTHRGLVALARRHGCTVFMVLQAAVAILLARLGAGTDIPIGTPVAGRLDEALDDLVGFFVNTLVLRTDVSGDPTVGELLARIRAADLAAFAHQDVPFERLVEVLNPARSQARHPLFQTMLSFDNAGVPAPEMPGVQAQTVPAGVTAKFDVSIGLAEHFGEDGTPMGIEGTLEYALDLFDADTALTLRARLVRILDALTADDDRPISRLDMLDRMEVRRLRELGASGPAIETATVPELIAHRAATAPKDVALVSADRTVTYGELDAAATWLAAHLRGRGAGPGTRIGVCLERGPDMVIALVAILKSGSAYLPLDPGYPPGRLAYLLEDADPQLIVTTSDLAMRVPLADRALVRLDLDDIAGAVSAAWTPVHPDELAYVIYTSGSTGRPKGVMVPHRGLAAIIAASVRAFGIEPGRRVLQHASLNFDNSAWEIFMALTAGAMLCLGRPDELYTGEGLTSLLRRQRVDVAVLTPAVLALLEPAEVRGVRTLLVGGEAFPPDLAARWADGRELYNTYGPTEASIHVSLEPIVAGFGGDTVPIGRPNSGVTTWVLDPTGALAAPNVVGNLYVGGVGVTRGYLGRPGLTAERFVPDPWTTGGRMYATGDRARVRPDGRLEFRGRADEQVTINGVRIEPEEVRTAVLALPEVTDAAVLAVDGVGLVAYVVADAPFDGDDARRVLRTMLPAPLIPGAFVAVAALPLTANGKVDRRALPVPDRATGTGRAPATETEKLLSELVADVLGVADVDVERSFFDLGGHSLLMIKLAARIRRALGVTVAVGTLFDADSVAGLARVLDSGVAADPLRPMLVLRAGSGDPVFLVHPGAGVGWGYRELARHLDNDRPVYAIQSPALRAADDLPPTLEALAGRYADLIRDVQPAGPYALAGWSFGGTVAHAVAACLYAAGARDVRMVLLDAYPGVSVDDLDADAARTEIESLGLDPAEAETVARAALYHARLLSGYPPAVVPGSALVLTATVDRAGRPDGAQLWQPYFDEPIAYRAVDVAHAEMTGAAALAAAGFEINQWLRCESSPASGSGDAS